MIMYPFVVCWPSACPDWRSDYLGSLPTRTLWVTDFVDFDQITFVPWGHMGKKFRWHFTGPITEASFLPLQFRAMRKITPGLCQTFCECLAGFREKLCDGTYSPYVFRLQEHHFLFQWTLSLLILQPPNLTCFLWCPGKSDLVKWGLWFHFSQWAPPVSS